jgi:YesN/AraC family two-component response regulator
MPGMSGAALAYEVRKRWPLIRTVVISGYANVEGLRLDLMGLNKPFRHSDLAEILARQANGLLTDGLAPNL